MKIVLNTKNSDLVNFFLRISKSSTNLPRGSGEKSIEIIASRVESGIFDNISNLTVDAYLIEVPSNYSQKAVDFIKKKAPYIPVVLFGPTDLLVNVSGADIYIPYCGESESENIMKNFFEISVWNINNYLNNFSKLRKITTTMEDVIEFGPCQYDPTRRTFMFGEKQVKKLSAKEGGILEVLAMNFGEVVKKEIILEKVWHKSDYFSGRSMDVYVTHLRALLKDHDINMSIKNISGVGLILE
jgi:hypothetical protein